MTIKEKKELLAMFESQFKNDLDKVITDFNFEEDYDKNMKYIVEHQNSIKTIKDLIELEKAYENIERVFELLEKNYIADKYYNIPHNFELKEVDARTIVYYFRKLRDDYNKEIREVDASFVFKEFHNYVDKVWEAI